MKSRIPQIAAKLPVTVQEAVKDAADRIAVQAKATAPRGETGDLKASIATRPGYGQTATGQGAHGFGVRWDVVAVWYWFLVEFGHEGTPFIGDTDVRGPSVVRPGRTGHTGKAAPHPFMIPAAEAERPRMLAEVKRALGNL